MTAPAQPAPAALIRVPAGTTAGAAVREAGLPGRGEPNAVVVVADADGKLRDLSWIPAADAEVREAFKLANLAMHAQALQADRWREDRRYKDGAQPRWRPFQLAFILLNLASVADAKHDDRGVADLIYFPTGGGKTEAYLGLAAFTLVLRRLRNPGPSSAGVTVLMRYTLRLLTLDQLGRAATLICALELERERDVARLGAWPFEIGLWVGSAATPNVMGSKHDKRKDTARARTIASASRPRRATSPSPAFSTASRIRSKSFSSSPP